MASKWSRLGSTATAAVLSTGPSKAWLERCRSQAAAVEGDDTSGHVAPGHVSPAGRGYQLGQPRLIGPRLNGLRQIAIGGGVGGDQSGNLGQRGREIAPVEPLEGPPGRGRELTNHEPSVRFGDPGHLCQRGTRVLDVAEPERDGDRVEGGIAEGQPKCVTRHERELRLPLPTDGKHPQRQVGGHHECARFDERHRGRTSPRSHIQDHLAGLRVDRLQNQPTPRPILTERQDVVGDVVARGHPIEHGRHVPLPFAQCRPRGARVSRPVHGPSLPRDRHTVLRQNPAPLDLEPGWPTLSPHLGARRVPVRLDVGEDRSPRPSSSAEQPSRLTFSDSGTLSCHWFWAGRLIGLSELSRAVGPAWRSGQNAHVAKRTTILKVSGLRRAFGPNTIFDRFNLEVRTGEAIALTGRNGAGKSTLLRCLVGADRPDDGSVEVCGNPMRETSPEIRRDVATVIDDLDFFPDLSVVEHLDLLARAHGISEPDDVVDEVLEEVQLVPQSGQLPGTLSSGQRRRLALATAFVRPRKLLILDEPEQRLDTEGVSWLAQRLKSERQKGLAIVFASHEPALVESVATRVVELGAPRG